MPMTFSKGSNPLATMSWHLSATIASLSATAAADCCWLAPPIMERPPLDTASCEEVLSICLCAAATVMPALSISLLFSSALEKQRACIYKTGDGETAAAAAAPGGPMATDNEDQEYDNDSNVFGQSIATDLVSGRQTLFCCLSCGIPFTLSNDAYIYKDDRILEFIRFVHGVRKHVCMQDGTKGSAMQWQLNLAHYLHRYLHRHIERSSNAAAAAAGPPAAAQADNASPGCWKNQMAFVHAATQLIKCIQGITCVEGGTGDSTFSNGGDSPPIVMDKSFMDITSPCCHACNIAASHTVKIKKVLGIYQNRQQRRLPGKALYILAIVCM